MNISDEDKVNVVSVLVGQIPTLDGVNIPRIYSNNIARDV